MKPSLILSLLLIFWTSCTSHDKSLKTEINYIGDKGYLFDSLPDLRDKMIVFQFDSYYNGDTVSIMMMKKYEKLLLNTQEIVGTAGIVELGRIDNPQIIELKINSFRPILIKADQDNNLFIVSYYPDSLVRINSVTHLPGGE